MNKDLDTPDFNWTDLLPDSNELVSLDDINPGNFSKSKQNKNEKVKFTNCQRKSLMNHFNPIPKFSYQEKTIQQQELLYSSSSAHSSSSSVNNHHHCHQLLNSMEINNECDMNDSYKTNKIICLNNEDLLNGKPVSIRVCSFVCFISHSVFNFFFSYEQKYNKFVSHK